MQSNHLATVHPEGPLTPKEYADATAYVTRQLPPRRRRAFEQIVEADPRLRAFVERHQQLLDLLAVLGSRYQIRKTITRFINQ